jgi:hypothetical protein
MSARLKFARGRVGMASDVDLVILTPHFAQLAENPSWFLQLDLTASSSAPWPGDACSSAATECAPDCRSKLVWRRLPVPNHPITEPHTTPPTRDVAITARTRGPLCEALHS